MTAQPTVSGRCSLLLLAWALLAGLWSSGGVDAIMQPWCSVIDTALVGWNVSSSPTPTHKRCHLACLDTPGCQSANYWYRKKECDLNSVSHLNVSSRHLVEKAGSVYTFTQQDAGCDVYSESSCHGNEPKTHCSDDIQDPAWRLVFKGVAGTGVDLYDMWTTMDWNSSYEASCHRRNNSLYRAWRNGQLNIRRVKLSLYNSSGVRAELIFNGTGSDIKSWFTQTRLISSPWDDLKSAQLTGGSGQFFSVDGDVNNLDRRFFINNYYANCDMDKGWLVVADSDATSKCSWETGTAAYPYPIILYSTTNQTVTWNDVLSNVTEYPPVKPTSTYRRLYRDSTVRSFGQWVTGCNWDSITSNQSADAMLRDFSSTINDAYEERFPEVRSLQPLEGQISLPSTSILSEGGSTTLAYQEGEGQLIAPFSLR
ncbi:uncharacterized protein LOC119736583 [Patiria miniata]|uniref:Apple domain-containing protein n=1 Tax=Patiria miniata TaxID=46514 RepID=A0A914AS93_PATMI|nr:uncharacterized protein LOC119736583 [Patiria miniata]